MAIPILGSIIDELVGGVKDVVSEVVVDKDKRNQINADLERMRLDYKDKAEARETEVRVAQIELNKQEAQHSSIFVAGWRPFVGWVSGVGLAYGVLIEPFFSWTARVVFEYAGNFPEIDPTVLIFALGGMLGIGSMRTIEKVKGVSTDVLADSPAASRNAPSRGIPVEQIGMNPRTGRIEYPPQEAPWTK